MSTGSDTGSDRALRTGEAATLAGVNIETLRYYERRGLLREPPRRSSGHRLYRDEDVRLVRAVKAAQNLGFTLAEVAEIMALTRRRGGRDVEGLRERVEAKLAEVNERIRALQEMRSDLQEVIEAECDRLVGCDCDGCPIDPETPPAPARSRLLQVIR
jgi:DNA-binding transcriptional MerR regulator